MKEIKGRFVEKTFGFRYVYLKNGGNWFVWYVCSRSDSLGL